MKAFPRRTFLHGMGSSILGLPWFESLASKLPDAGVAQRLAIYYVPIGVVRRTFFPGEENGVTPLFNRDNFDAESTKTHISKGEHPLELTATMKPLWRVKDKVSLITGMDRTFQPGTDVHAQCASCFLSSASPFSARPRNIATQSATAISGPAASTLAQLAPASDPSPQKVRSRSC